jgi:hypothetical protein
MLLLNSGLTLSVLVLGILVWVFAWLIDSIKDNAEPKRETFEEYTRRYYEIRNRKE